MPAIIRGQGWKTFHSFTPIPFGNSLKNFIFTVAGFFGEQCLHVCKCLNGADCDVVTGSCDCQPGFTGLYCDSICAEGSFGVGCNITCSCHNRAYCNHTNGHCSCTPGWIGPSCEFACGVGLYGQDCLESCQCENGAACDHVTGSCRCAAGYHGNNCQLPCPGISILPYSFRVQHYFYNTFRDDPEKGFLGSDCTEICPDGFYGQNCSTSCECVNLRSCNHVNGSCNCTDGHTGERCERACEQGFYGNQCMQICSCTNGALCDHVTGACTCKAGWEGSDCSRPCRDGMFGMNCQELCTCQHGRCDHISGVCSCYDGFTGLQCSAPVSSISKCRNALHHLETKRLVLSVLFIVTVKMVVPVTTYMEIVLARRGGRGSAARRCVHRVSMAMTVILSAHVRTEGPAIMRQEYAHVQEVGMEETVVKLAQQTVLKRDTLLSLAGPKMSITVSFVHCAVGIDRSCMY
ncbi:hypothetical protein BSL78_08758 [Apostichopus japonicus]|uniref:EGF-like domain-containing protein n=1 Tax=Stichopus japonicus TaxID=307972 RepID=A0A2G8L2F9_STIJA|nr:hypothetical protein BSL78_08758 [Apostichopus japonicus]